MSLAALARRLADAGTPIDAIIMALEAVEAEQARAAEGRAKAAERKRRQRAKVRDEGGTVTGQSRDCPEDTPLPPVPLDKETSPTPPKEINPPEPPSPRDCPADAEPALKPEHVVDKWNEIAPAIGKPPIRKLTPERREAVKARINQNSIDDFVTVFGNIRGSPFLQEWRGMGFDWVMKKSNFQKVLEGNYNG